MTLKKAYEEIMDNVEVTPEMRGRVLRHIREAEAAGLRRRGVMAPGVRRVLAAAACLTVLIAGIALGPRLLEAGGPEDPPVLVTPNLIQADSAEELAGLVGFEVIDVEGLPFEPQETTYLAYWGEMAEIQYSAENVRAVFRKSAGSEDNSGDFGTYDAVEEHAVGETSVVLKGSGGQYMLAIWQHGGFSYSLSISCGASLEEWSGIIAGIH